MQTVIDIKNLTVEYNTPGGYVGAVRNFNLHIHRGETYGLVGESGSGKSTVAWVIMRYLADNGRVTTGEVYFKGEDLLSLSMEKLRQYRGKRIAMVYQDPMTSLNPSMKVGRQIQEAIELHQGGDKKQTWRQSVEMLERVFIVDPASSAHKYPHELSGGQQQRVVIALALACNPDLLILDEPTTGLDVTTEANILDLIDSLKDRYGSAILFITHNLGVIAKVSDRLGVMYSGHLVEAGLVKDIFRQPLHPYTEGLLNCIPKIEQKSVKVDLQPIKGTLPDLHTLPTGCIFHPRCPYAEASCRQTEPGLEQTGKGRESACLRWRQLYAQETEYAVPEATHRESDIPDRIGFAGNGSLISLKSVKKILRLPDIN